MKNINTDCVCRTEDSEKPEQPKKDFEQRMVRKLVEVIQVNPDLPVYFWIPTDLISDYEYINGGIENIVVDEGTNEVDGEYVYLREDDYDVLREIWEDNIQEIEHEINLKIDQDVDFEQWLDQFKWEKAILVKMSSCW